MKCTVCGAGMSPTTTDLPFKLSEERIVILKQLPVLQCTSCREYLIEDAVMARIEALLGRADSSAELEVLRYAA
ncbi:MAG: type II toxin-antitoxin system MqsA family antitoxin [Desulfurellaceae bacterium]|nr:type II toxin-antitoxin system MqsA family antitoxin [Desulfurellaceae bacterium]